MIFNVQKADTITFLLSIDTLIYLAKHVNGTISSGVLLRGIFISLS